MSLRGRVSARSNPLRQRETPLRARAVVIGVIAWKSRQGDPTPRACGGDGHAASARSSVCERSYLAAGYGYDTSIRSIVT